MCTALSLNKSKNALFGRNMDIETNFNQQVVITPRNYPWKWHFYKNDENKHFAMIGMATVIPDEDNNLYPLYADACNEYGLAVAGLNFPEFCFYSLPKLKKNLIELAPYEVIPWILSTFKSVSQLKTFLKNQKLAIVNKPFSAKVKLMPLHFMVCDKQNEAIVIEPTIDGVRIYDNEVGVLTNSPTFDWQLQNLKLYSNLNNTQKYDAIWSDFKLNPFGQGMGAVGLPGDCSPASRFVRTAFYRANSNCDDNRDDLLVQFFHILDAVSMVKGSIKLKNGEDDITLYSSCMDLNELTYYYKTYKGYHLNAVSLKKQHLDKSGLVQFGYNEKTNINFID